MSGMQATIRARDERTGTTEDEAWAARDAASQDRLVALARSWLDAHDHRAAVEGRIRARLLPQLTCNEGDH